MSKFEEWWNSNENPANRMPESTRSQIKWHVQEAFKAGQKAGNRQGRDEAAAFPGSGV